MSTPPPLREQLILDWKAAGKKTRKHFDIESTPLQVQTDSALGSMDVMRVRFLKLSTTTGARVEVTFSDPPTYTISSCGINNVIFNMPGGEKHRIWTFIKHDRTLQLLCNGVEIFNLNFGESANECREMWSLDFEEIKFSKNVDGVADTASDFFRAYKRCGYFRN